MLSPTYGLHVIQDLDLISKKSHGPLNIIHDLAFISKKQIEVLTTIRFRFEINVESRNSVLFGCHEVAEEIHIFLDEACQTENGNFQINIARGTTDPGY